MYFTENDMKMFLCDVIRNTAKRLNVEGFEWLDYTELLEKIEHSNADVYSKLQVFFTAYESWHSFHVKIEAEKKSGRMSPTEQSEHISLMAERDKCRKDLIQSLPE